MRTEMDLLAEARPDLHALALHTMTATDRAYLLDTITATGRAQPGRARSRSGTTRAYRRPWRAVTLLAAAAVASLLVVALPAGTPGAAGTAAAATLHNLAGLLIGHAGPIVGPHQFAYAEIIETQYGREPAAMHYRQWQATNGDAWMQVITATGGGTRPAGCYHRVHDAPPPPGVSEGYVGPDPRYPDFSSETQPFLASLPTDPVALRDYLRSHTRGGGPTSQLVFRAAVDLLANGMTPPEVRAAAIRMLALDTRHVTVKNNSHDAASRPAIMLTFAFDHMSSDGPGATIQNYPGQSESLYFDPRTAQLLQLSDLDQGHVYYVQDIVATDVVDAVPADVLSCVARGR